MRNNWIESKMREAFPLYQKMNGMLLHFKGDYSYPKYNGATKVGFNSFYGRQRKDVLQYIQLREKLSSLDSIDKFLFVNALKGRFSVYHLNTKTAVEDYEKWMTLFSTKEKLNGFCEIFINNHSSSGCLITLPGIWTDSNIAACNAIFMDIITSSDIVWGDKIDLHRLMCAVWMISKQPKLSSLSDENEIYKILINKIIKIKEFTDWFCLTD